MTREEAIKVLQRMKYPYKCNKRKMIISNVDRDNEALDMAIEALSQEPNIDMESDEIKILQKRSYLEGFHGALKMSVKQEPCDDTVSIRKDVLKCRVGDIVAYNVEWLKKNWQMEMDIVCGVKPCDDVVSREAVLDIVCGAYEKDGWGESNFYKAIKELPSVTQKSGVWDRSCTCSVCGQWRILESEKNSGKYKYCPNCGAKMESEDEE